MTRKIIPTWEHGKSTREVNETAILTLIPPIWWQHAIPMTKTTTTMMFLDRATHTTEAIVEAVSVLLVQSQSSVDAVINLRLQQMRSSMKNVTSTPTSTKMADKS
jgi:hypothetical protein